MEGSSLSMKKYIYILDPFVNGVGRISHCNWSGSDWGRTGVPISHLPQFCTHIFQ